MARALKENMWAVEFPAAPYHACQAALRCAAEYPAPGQFSQIIADIRRGHGPGFLLSIHAMFFLLISVGLAIWLAVNRLRDFRATTSAARKREELYQEAEAQKKLRLETELELLRALYKKLGEKTWCLFWWQIGTFGTGIFLATSSISGCRMSFWRCPVRGLAVEIRELPRTSYSFDRGETWRMLHCSDSEDKVAAKKVLALDMLLTAIGLYQGLPNAVFDEQVATIKWLLTAPPSVPAENWMKVLEKVHPKSRPLLRTHESDLRTHLLGEKYGGATGPIALTVRPRLEAMERRV